LTALNESPRCSGRRFDARHFSTFVLADLALWIVEMNSDSNHPTAVCEDDLKHRYALAVCRLQRRFATQAPSLIASGIASDHHRSQSPIGDGIGDVCY
jgi:hypothetical protein